MATFGSGSLPASGSSNKASSEPGTPKCQGSGNQPCSPKNEAAGVGVRAGRSASLRHKPAAMKQAVHLLAVSRVHEAARTIEPSVKL